MTWQDSYDGKLWNYVIRKAVLVRFKRSKRWRSYGFASKDDNQKFATRDEALAVGQSFTPDRIIDLANDRRNHRWREFNKRFERFRV